MTRQSALYRGRVMHRRLRPKRHRLAYRLAMVLLDLDELDELDRKLRLFSLARWNLYSFCERDYGNRSAEPLRQQIERLLSQAGLGEAAARIALLTMPRLLGFAFNPISLYYCYASDGALRAVIYEVNNTFGQRHSYLIEVGDQPGPAIHQAAPKRLHVSPFMAMEQSYSFRLTPPGDQLSLAITSRDAHGPLLFAALEGARQPLSDAALLRAFAAMPLMTFKVVAGIGWEALKLWLKRVPVHRRPAAPPPPLSIIKAAREP